MNVYLVRHIETKVRFGLVWGSDLDVWEAVDRRDDTTGYECAMLPSGVMLSSKSLSESEKTVVGEDGTNHPVEVLDGLVWKPVDYLLLEIVASACELTLH